MSPFAPAFAEAQLPPAFRRQFLVPAQGVQRVLLLGRMECVWHRPRWLRPILGLLARRDLLFPETGADVPAWLVIEPTGDGQQHWRRTFRFSVLRRFDAVMAHDGTHVVERLGRVELPWELEYRPPVTLVVTTGNPRIRLAGRLVNVPRRVAPSARAVEIATGVSEIAVELVVSAPLLGPVFGYAGRFRLSAIHE